MKIKVFTNGPFATNCYVVADEVAKKALLIDCAHGSFLEISTLLQEEGWELEKAVLTHSHFDHIGDLKRIQEAFSPRIYVHASDKQNLLHPGSDKIPLICATQGVRSDCELKEGDTLKIGSIEIQVLEVPGHCPGSLAFFLPNEKVVFGGDLIFKNGRGRTDLPGCNTKILFESIAKILALGDDVVIFSGHGEKTTVGQERRHYA